MDVMLKLNCPLVIAPVPPRFLQVIPVRLSVNSAHVSSQLTVHTCWLAKLKLPSAVPGMPALPPVGVVSSPPFHVGNPARLRWVINEWGGWSAEAFSTELEGRSFGRHGGLRPAIIRGR